VQVNDRFIFASIFSTCYNKTKVNDMLLEELNKLVVLGSKRPLFLWLDEYRKIAKGLAVELKQVAGSLPESTEVKKNVNKLVLLLESDNPNELDLAKNLSHVAELFSGGIPSEHKDLINGYIRNVMKFINIAQAGEFSRQVREKLLTSLSDEEQKNYDRRLFEHEGMIYCLEFYLAIYKSIQDAPNESEKRKYIESNEINLGAGSLPGLWVDFSRDEVLGKFIYCILDEKIRTKLTQAYFETKNIMVKIEMNCDKQAVCSASYSEVDLKQILDSFREFIVILLKTFVEVGIERLSSFFFKPYGDKPLVNDVIKICSE